MWFELENTMVEVVVFVHESILLCFNDIKFHINNLLYYAARVIDW